MNAYPAELVVHLHPFLLVTGLVPARDAQKRANALPAPCLQYPALCARLAELFTRRGRPAVWAPPGGAPRFRYALADETYTYPPAKTRPTPRSASDVARRALSSLPPRSPLSPLYVGGPLFPDGILAPAWVRKHTEYIPSVHVAFVCLPLATRTDDVALIESLTKVRTTDAARGIRTCVVFLCAPDALGRPDTETRLAHIRRSAALDARGAVHVLNTATTDLEAFAWTLERAVGEPAAEYYRERARHVRRNRARYPPPPSVVQPVLAAASAAGALRPGPVAMLAPEGWTVRTAAKLGAFAEMQGMLSEARTQYAEAYTHLVQSCLGNTKLYAPRTKRWAEAKVLADTLSFKLVRLHLYENQAGFALQQFAQHAQRIAALSIGWGIGTGTYEYWSWLAKQFQLLGDLVLQAARTDPARAARFPAVLPEAGTHLYHAAVCTMERAARFRACAQDTELPNYANEARVDHTARTVELLGSAFDAYMHTRHVRHAHLAAVRIALLYTAAGQHAAALPYVERALRWYRRDNWDVPRFLLVAHAAACAHALGDARATLPYLVELLQPVPHEVAPLQQHWTHTLRALLTPHAEALEDSAAHASTETPALAVELNAAPLATVACVFARPNAPHNTPAAFQVQVHAVCPHVTPSLLRIYLHGRTDPLFVVPLQAHGATTCDLGAVAAEHTTDVSTPCAAHGPLVLSGALTGPIGVYRFTHAILTLATRIAHIDLPLAIAPSRTWHTPRGPLPLPPCAESQAVELMPPTLHVALEAPPAVLPGECHALTVEVEAPLVRGVLVLAPESGAALLEAPDAEPCTPHQYTTPAGRSTVYVRAPDTPGPLRLRLYGVASTEPHAVPATHVDCTTTVTHAWDVRGHMQWMPGPAPRTGRLTSEVAYLGPMPLVFEHAEVHVGAGAEAGPPLGEASGVLHPHDTIVWVTQVTERAGMPNAHAHGTDALLALQWRRDTAAPVSTTHVRLAPLVAPPAAHVQVQMEAPGQAYFERPTPMRVAVSSAAPTALDLVVEVDSSEAFFLAGPRRHHMPLLLPGETRTVNLALVARTSGMHTLPRIRAYEQVPGAEPVALGVPLPGVVQVNSTCT